jgi:hypothetical protein
MRGGGKAAVRNAPRTTATQSAAWMRGRKGKGRVMLACLWRSRARDRKREESTVASGGSLLSGGRGGMGVGLVPCLGRRWNEEGVAGCGATWATTAWARRLWAARTAEGAL